jgi:hypothetical protein
MPFISVTRLRLRSYWHFPKFVFYSIRSRRQAQRAPGNLRVLLGAEQNRVFWTITMWRDEAAMRQFMLSGAHRAAMPLLAGMVDEAATSHWVQDTEKFPNWPEAYQRLRQAPKFSRIKYPSEDHAAGRLPHKAD